MRAREQFSYVVVGPLDVMLDVHQGSIGFPPDVDPAPIIELVHTTPRLDLVTLGTEIPLARKMSEKDYGVHRTL